MNRYLIAIGLCTILPFSICTSLFCQANKDSLLRTNSMQWLVKLNKGLFGLSKPDFGPYHTIAVVKLDSAVIKKKIKDSSYIGAEISGEATDWDQMKFMTIEKTKFYQLSLGTESNRTEAVFAIASVSHEKRQTFLGKILSKNDEGKNEVLDYNRDVQGIINTGIDSALWSFFIDNFTRGGEQTIYGFPSYASIKAGYIKSHDDSLYMQTYASFDANIVLINQKGEHVAALALKQKKPGIWISTDMNQSYQHAIAALFAVIISIKDF